MDSALTAYYLKTPRTYSLGFDARDRSELDAARSAAAHLNTVHTDMTAQAADFEQALDAIPRLFDEPFGDSAAWSNYLIAEFARREVTVALSGEGGDEVFCGYPRYWSRVGARSNLLNRSLARFLPPLTRFASSMQRHAYVGLPAYAAALGGMTALQIDGLLAEPWAERDYDYLWFYRQFWREDLSPLAQLRWLDLNTDLAEGLLTKVDRTSMAHSLEVRPAAARSSAGGVHVERGSRIAGGSAPAARQATGAPAHAAEAAPGSSGASEIRVRVAGAPLAQAPPSDPRRCRAAAARARSLEALRGQRVSQGLVAAGARPLVHRL